MAQNQTLRTLTGPVRTLPSRLSPVPGESFASYVERLAASYAVPLSAILTATGLVRGDGDPVVPAWGIAMDKVQLSDFAHATRLSRSAVAALLVDSLPAPFCDLRDVDPRQPSTVRRAAVREWVRFNGSRFCPGCIAEGVPVWQLRWKLTWSFACVKHACLLLDRCQECGRFAGLGRGDKTATPAYLAKVLSLGCCRNVPPAQRAGFGQQSMPCGADLRSQTSATLVPGGRALAAQRALDDEIDEALLQGATKEAAGVREPGRAAAAVADEARSIASLVLLCGEEEHFCLETPALQSSVLEHLAKRRRPSREQAEEAGHSTRTRAYVKASLEAPLTAAALTPAVEIALLHSHEQLVEALLPLAASVRRQTRTTNRQIAKDLHFSERLSRAFADASAVTGSFGRMSTRYPVAQAAQATCHLGPANIPQLMPEEVYQQHFSEFLPGVLAASGRAFCAISAVKSFGLTWADAASLLELPQAAARYASTRAMPIINSGGHGPAFLAALQHWMARLGRDESPTDYAARRASLRHLEDLPASLWQQVCLATGRRAGKAGRRSRYAAVWLWAELTQGDWRQSPAIAALGDSPSVREVYRRLVTIDMAPVLPVLLEHAQAALMTSPSTLAPNVAAPLERSGLVAVDTSLEG